MLLWLVVGWVSGSIPLSAHAQRQMEKLGRGVVALRASSTQVYVGWRLLGNDPSDVAFNLYRAANGGAPVRINASPLANTTDYVDTPGNLAGASYTYSVRPVLNGAEVPDTFAHPLSAPFTLPVNAPTRQYLPVRLQPTPDGAHKVKFCWVGDLDGDGEYDFVVDRYHPTLANQRQFVEAYKRDGTLVWRMDMGYNSTNQYAIEPGSSSIGIGHGDNLTVYDLDGDGKAEVIVRTARGVVFANGTTLAAPNDSVQYLSILNGMTGAEMARATVPNPFISDGPFNGHMAIFYPDGVRPSVLWAAKNRRDDGGFQGLVTVWDYRNGQLTQRWSWNDQSYYAPEGHQIRLGDVNHDGKDEFIDIGYTLKSDGTPLFNVPKVNHGDRFHLLDIDPDRPGLETYLIQQDNPSGLATAMIDAATGKIIRSWYAGSVVDVGRGLAADIDPGSRGAEMFSTQANIYDARGNVLYSAHPFPPEAIWWEGGLSRGFLATVGSTAESPAIARFDPSNPSAQSRIYTIYNETAPGVYWANGGRPQFWGDILGDWREEVVVVANDNSELRIYTTKLPAAERLYTLMHNAQYRIQATTKGYVQASYVDYYLGTGMEPPPPAPFSNAKLVWRGGGANVWDTTTANWFTNDLWVSNTTPVIFNTGDTVLFDVTGSNHTSIELTGSLAPGEVTVYSPRDFIMAGGGSLDGTMRLTKAGAGRLVFNSTNHYSGATLIAEGPFIVNGSLPFSPVGVRGGVWLDGRLGGTGSVGGAVTIRAGGGFSPGAGTNSPGTLTISNHVSLLGLTLNDFDLSDDPTGLAKSNDHVIITGNLTLQGTNTFVIRKLNGTLTPGVYPLISYAGTFSGNLTNLRVSGLEGIPVTFTNPPGQLAVVVKSTRPPAALTWTGGQGGNAWDLATSSNWLNGVTRDVFAPRDAVRFDNLGASNLTVNLSGSLPAGDVIVDSSSNYTLAGSGAMIGSGGLTKSNSGTLTISALNNEYTGRTLLAGGTTVVPELDAVGFPSPLGNQNNPSPTNLVLSGNATLRVTGASYTDRGMTLGAGTNSLDVSDGANQLTIAGTVVGAGVLQKVGSGTLALTASNSYSGGTIIQAGTIVLGGTGGTGNRYGLGAGVVTLVNGTLSLLDLQSSYTYAHSFHVPAGGSGRVNCDGRSTMTGSLTGSGTFTVMTPYVRTDFSGNWSAFSGQISVIADSDGGNFRCNNAAGYPSAKLNLANNVSLQSRRSGTPTLSIGELSGAQGCNLSASGGNDGLPVNWSVGGLNTSATFAGNTYNGIGLIKVGTGTWILSGTNIAHSGVTTVNGGTLVINGNAANAAGAVTVGVAGTLGGTGVIGGNTTVNGTLAPGAAVGQLTFRGNLNLNGGSVSVVEIRKGLTSDSVRVLGAVSYGGTLLVTNVGAGLLAAGDTFQLFDAASRSGVFQGMILPPLGAGLAWATSALASSGSVTIVAVVPPVISSVRIAGNALVISGTGGAPNVNYQVLSSTNARLPVALWTRIGTNQFGPAGGFNYTNIFDSTMPEKYFLLQVP